MERTVDKNEGLNPGILLMEILKRKQEREREREQANIKEINEKTQN